MIVTKMLAMVDSPAMSVSVLNNWIKRFVNCDAATISGITVQLRQNTHLAPTFTGSLQLDQMYHRAPDEKHVTTPTTDDLYVSAWQGFAFVVFNIDVFAGMIMDWWYRSSICVSPNLERFRRHLAHRGKPGRGSLSGVIHCRPRYR